MLTKEPVHISQATYEALGPKGFAEFKRGYLAAEAAFDAAATQPSRFKVLSAEEFCGDVDEQQRLLAAWMAKDRLKHPDEYTENELDDAQTETAPAPERFHIYSHGEMLAREPPTWIVPGVLPEAELCEIFGESGSGKSFWMYDLFAAIHTGGMWNGLQCRKGRTLIIAAEGARGFRNRAEAYEIENKQSDLPSFVVDAPNLLDPTDAPAFVTACAAAGPWTAIGIDTRSAVTPGGNENSGEDGGKLIAYCKLLHRKTGALVILIHHVGVGDKDRGRGWTGVKAACDTQILITRDNDMRSWKLAKQKDSADGPEGPHGHFKLRPVKLANGDTSCVVEHCEKPTGQFESKDSEPSGAYQTHIAEFLRGKGPQSMEDLRAYVRGQVPRGEGTKDRRGDCTSKAFNALRQKHLVNVTEGSDGDRVQWHVQPSSGNDPFGD